MCQGLVNEVSPLLKVGAEVELHCVVGLDAMIRDASARVELCVGVDVHEGVALRRVEDVRHSQFLQTHHILGYESEGRWRRCYTMERRVLDNSKI